MKQLRVLALLVFFLHSKMGVALNIHYCGGHIANVSWVFDAKGCGMKTTVSHTDQNQHSQLNSKKCCDDEEVVEQNTSEQSKIETKNRIVQPSVKATIPFFVFTRPLTNKSLIVYAGNAPPNEELYLRHCSFIFYG